MARPNRNRSKPVIKIPSGIAHRLVAQAPGYDGRIAVLSRDILRAIAEGNLVAAVLDLPEGKGRAE